MLATRGYVELLLCTSVLDSYCYVTMPGSYAATLLCWDLLLAVYADFLGWPACPSFANRVPDPADRFTRSFTPPTQPPT